MMYGSRVSATPRLHCFSAPTISSSLFLFSTLHYSPIISNSPNSSLYQSPNKNTLVLHRSDSNLVCFQQSGSTSGGDLSVHEGLVTQSLSNGMYTVELDSGLTILGRVSGKIRQRTIQILPGDRVQIEVSHYDTSRGRIIYRITEENTNPDENPKKPGGGGKSRNRRR